ALMAAKEFKIETGGHMVEGYKTLVGTKTHYNWMYGCVDDAIDVKQRICMNIYESDATIRFATDFSTHKEFICLRTLQKLNKLHLDIYMQPFWRVPGDSG